MTLKEKFESAILEQHGNLVTKPLVESCVSIAREDAISFLKWFIEDDDFDYLTNQ